GLFGELRSEEQLHVGAQAEPRRRREVWRERVSDRLFPVVEERAQLEDLPREVLGGELAADALPIGTVPREVHRLGVPGELARGEVKLRSEERRVGKECRAMCPREHEIKKDKLSRNAKTVTTK